MAAPKPSPEPSKGEEKPAESSSSASAAGGGAKAWLPLAATIVAMPLLAYATTTFMLIPKLQKSLGPATAHEAAAAPEAAASHGGGGGSHGAKADKASPSGKGKVTVPMKEKILVNVSGTAGTRYLVVNFSVMGSSPDLKSLLEENEAQIRDLAGGVLGTKTIADLEKPGARNLIRSELITVLNNSLGAGQIQEIFFTEFAVQ